MALSAILDNIVVSNWYLHPASELKLDLMAI